MGSMTGGPTPESPNDPHPSPASSMANYTVVENSVGLARSFAITVGLRAGYDDDAQIDGAREVISAAKNWMKERAGRNEKFLTGTTTPRGDTANSTSRQ